jgi:hypothetical protein
LNWREKNETNELICQYERLLVIRMRRKEKTMAKTKPSIGRVPHSICTASEFSSSFVENTR